MPNPLELLTKPIQIGFGALNAIKGLVAGGDGDQPSQEEPLPHQKLQREEQGRAAQRQNRTAPPKQLDDATITGKVETILFRDDDVDKGKIDVNTVDGVVWLRGEAKTPEQIKALEGRAREIPEVREVENLLHLPKTPPQRKARRATSGTAAARKRAPKRTTSERKATPAANAEPTPKELASTGKGRQPAPLGSSSADNGNGNGNGAGGSSSGS